MHYFEFSERNRLTRAIRLETNVANRYLCDVLSELKTCHETRNYSPVLGLVEEIQVLANRMESALSDKRDVLSYEKRRPVLKDEIKELEWKKEELEEEVRRLEFKLKELNRELPKKD